MKRPLINRARCKKCEVIIQSRTSHDLRHCKCGAIFIDGGQDYQRYGWGLNYTPGENENLDDIIDFSFSVYDNND
ncbi:hypothetical protein MHI57_24860 [Cytobacillus sp. FSL K6-0129]|uniref:DUF7695 domain-containing protein n=1 Tax=Cytobacillus sp. FSL K6-0129 TaxID=2921421 RepID=UPI0030F5EBC9